MQTWIVITFLGIIALAVIYLLSRNSSSATNANAPQDDARRFARLLVAEIKLYQATKIERGKLNNDIYSQLETEIDEARRKYDKRVNRNLMEKDYFDEEIVRQLADGDTSKMGVQYTQSKKH